MTVRPILVWPDPRLSDVSRDTGGITDATRGLITDMLDTMYSAGGRGLAAPQIGEMTRIFVMDAGWKAGASEPRVFLDPEITGTDGPDATLEEGCLSIPEITVPVCRPSRVKLAWTDPDGARLEAWFEGFEAACVQHETDHLNGVVTLDHLNEVDRARVLRAGAVALS